MLDVHPPHHAASTWRDFFIHIATIVVGLLIAIGLEQTVEYVHHRSEVAETRRLLREEREQNRKNFAANVASFRYEVLALQNDMTVLQYLRQHPGTAEQDLPGVLLYGAAYQPVVESAWKAATTTNVTQLMDRLEVADLSSLYAQLTLADVEETELWHATVKANAYLLSDPNLAHFTPAQTSEQIELTELAMEMNYRRGVVLQNIGSEHEDFTGGPSLDELNRYSGGFRDALDRMRIGPARERTLEKLAPALEVYRSAAKAAEKR